MYLGIVNVNNFPYIKGNPLRNLPLDIYFNQIPKSISIQSLNLYLNQIHKSISIQLVYINMLLSDF